MSIDEVRAWFVARGWGISGAEQLFYERLAGQLATGETLEQTETLLCGYASGQLVLTDQRIAHLSGPGSKSMAVTSVNRADVTSATVSGWLSPRTVIVHRGGKMKLAGGAKARVREIVAALGT